MARDKPGALSFGSVGFGSTHHLAGELLNAMAGIDIVHVPYRGDSQAVTALLGGEIPVIIGTPVLLAQQIQSGAMRGLAVTSPSRISLLPDIPTADESGVKGYDVRTWAGLLTPKGTPQVIISALNAATLDALKDPEVKRRLEAAVGGDVSGSSPEEMRTLIEKEIVKWKAVVERAKLPRI
ncbi:tripartite-type tricarboxylate transporter receptor subunit TctC [Bradyrhizobium sp. USDA 4369]